MIKLIKIISNIFYLNNKFFFLPRKLYPGLYFITFNEDLKIKNVTPFIFNYVRNFLRDTIFLNTINLKDENRSLILSLLFNESLKEMKIVKKVGLAHYFAISGFHLNIINNFLPKSWISIIIIGIYSLTIWSPSALRSFIFLLIKFLAHTLGEEISLKKQFFISLAISLLIFDINNISMHFSFVATSVFVLFPETNFFIQSFIIHLFASLCSLYFFGTFNLLAFIPSIIFTQLFLVITISSFLTLLFPIPFLDEILTYSIYLIKKSELFVYTINYQISLKILLIFYLMILFGIIFQKR